MNEIVRIDFFGRLAGRWSFVREISGQGSMSGVATVTEVSPGRAEYVESGELTLRDGTRLRAEQRYLYERADDGYTIYFAETGEVFERVAFGDEHGGEWGAEATHLCGGDVYESTYLFCTDGRFSVRHVVSGPRKDYVIMTEYRRD